MSARRANGHALKPAQKARLLREAAVDALLLKGAAGVLSIPEAVQLAELVAEERRLDALTRRRLTETTRALERHREAAGVEIRRLEAELTRSSPQSLEHPPPFPELAVSRTHSEP
ncbi:hypothetical protein [Streptomyces canus]|uniref:hypothetical protein n=1 Tax=Streptomyces canus TaxID=58343 RepID=UPI0038058EB2